MSLDFVALVCSVHVMYTETRTHRGGLHQTDTGRELVRSGILGHSSDDAWFSLYLLFSEMNLIESFPVDQPHPQLSLKSSRNVSEPEPVGDGMLHSTNLSWVYSSCLYVAERVKALLNLLIDC